MGFGKRNAPAGQEVHDIDVEVVAQVERVGEALCRPAPGTAGHRDRLHVRLMDRAKLRRVEAVHMGVALADPVKAAGRVPSVKDRPRGTGGDIGVAARPQLPPLRAHGQLQGAEGDKDHRLGAVVRLRIVGTAARGQLHRILREGFRKAGQGPGEDPDARPVPTGQKAGDNIALHIGRDQRVSLGKDRPVQRIARLVRVATGREGVAQGVMLGIWHGRMVLTAARYICRSAVGNGARFLRRGSPAWGAATADCGLPLGPGAAARRGCAHPTPSRGHLAMAS